MLLRIALLAIIQLWLINFTLGVVPQITRLNVQCDRTGMKVNVDFDIPFNGIIFSKGHYSDANCRHVSPLSQRSGYNFFIPSTLCGTIQTDTRRDGTIGFKNIIIIQNDPEYQEVWDMARKISCDWVTRIDKYVTFAPFGVDMLGIKEIAFPGDTVDCWMDIQRGHGPYAPTIAGVVPIGEKLTIVIYIRDRDGSFDIHVKDCYAYDSPDYKNPNVRAIQLTDVRGCPIKEKLVKGFYRTRDVRNSGATVIAYGVINAFKFPEAMDVFLACNVEVCKGGCENPCQPEVTVAGGDADVSTEIDEQSRGPSIDAQRKVDPDEGFEVTTMRNEVDTEDMSGGDGAAAGGGEAAAGGDEAAGGGEAAAGGDEAAGGGESAGRDEATGGGEAAGGDEAAGGGETAGGDEAAGGDTETADEGSSTEKASDSDSTNGDSETSNGDASSTEAPAAEAEEKEEEEESRRAAASNPVRVSVKSRAKKSHRLRAPVKPKSSAKLVAKTTAKPVAKPVAKLVAKPAAKPKAKSVRITSNKRKQQNTARGKRAKRSIVINGLNGTFPEMTHSISIISPVEDFDENELEIWERAKETNNKVCLSTLSLLTSSIILTGLSILFSLSLLLSYGRLRQIYGEKSFS